MKEVREAWFDDQLDLDPARLVFVDEPGSTPRWRACVGGPVRGALPDGGAARTLGRARRWCWACAATGGGWAPHLRRGAMTGGGLPGLRAGGTGATIAPRRHADHGQPPATRWQAYARRSRRWAHGSCTCRLLARLQSDRAGVCQDQGAATQGRGAQRGRPTPRHQRILRCFKPRECRRIIAAAGTMRTEMKASPFLPER